MRNAKLYLAICISLFTLTSASLPNLKKNYVKFDKNLYASRYEVTNKEYREFLLDLKKNNHALYAECLYDSTQWKKKMPEVNSGHDFSFYNSIPSFDNHPVVNITLKAANLYCEWLTNRYRNS